MFTGVCVVFFLKDWVKIGPLVILKKFQGKGYGGQLLKQVVDENRDKNLFIASSNKVVEKMALRLGFTRKKYFDLPISIKLFLLKQLYDYLNARLVLEAVRKKMLLKRGKFKFFLRTI